MTDPPPDDVAAENAALAAEAWVGRPVASLLDFDDEIAAHRSACASGGAGVAASISSTKIVANPVPAPRETATRCARHPRVRARSAGDEDASGHPPATMRRHRVAVGNTYVRRRREDRERNRNVTMVAGALTSTRRERRRGRFGTNGKSSQLR